MSDRVVRRGDEIPVLPPACPFCRGSVDDKGNCIDRCAPLAKRAHKNDDTTKNVRHG